MRHITNNYLSDHMRKGFKTPFYYATVTISLDGEVEEVVRITGANARETAWKTATEQVAVVMQRKAYDPGLTFKVEVTEVFDEKTTTVTHVAARPVMERGFGVCWSLVPNYVLPSPVLDITEQVQAKEF